MSNMSMTNKDRWAVSVVALHRKPRIDGWHGDDVSIRHVAFVLEAASHDEALGKAWRVGFKLYPSEGGWANHHAMAVFVSDASIVDPDDVEAASVP